MNKLFCSEYHARMTNDVVDWLGADATVHWGEATRDGLAAPPPGTTPSVANLVGSFLMARSGTIYAGTSQVQRNILGEMVLGLPKEPRPT